MKILKWKNNTLPLSCHGQITQSKINEICPLAIQNQISTISMHTSSLVKIHWNLLKLSSGNENMNRHMTDWRKAKQTLRQPTRYHNTPQLSCGRVQKGAYLEQYIYWKLFTFLHNWIFFLLLKQMAVYVAIKDRFCFLLLNIYLSICPLRSIVLQNPSLQFTRRNTFSLYNCFQSGSLPTGISSLIASHFVFQISLLLASLFHILLT